MYFMEFFVYPHNSPHPTGSHGSFFAGKLFLVELAKSHEVIGDKGYEKEILEKKGDAWRDIFWSPATPNIQEMWISRL